MTMCEIWNWIKDIVIEVFKYLGGAAALAALLVWFFRKVVSNTIDSWFEKKNKQYQKDIDKELKDYQTKLDDKSKEVQNKLDTQLEIARIQYGSLYGKRVEAIQTFYDWIIYFYDILSAVEIMQKYKVESLLDAVHNFSPAQLGRIIDVENQLLLFNSYFIANKLFLPMTTMRKIDSITAILLSKALTPIGKDQLIVGYENVKGKATNTQKEQLTDAFKSLESVYKSFSESEYSINEILEDIECEFRQLIGTDLK